MIMIASSAERLGGTGQLPVFPLFPDVAERQKKPLTEIVTCA